MMTKTTSPYYIVPLLLWAVVLLVANVATGQQGGQRRGRQVKDFFPGCLADGNGFVNGTQDFIHCLERRGDARCLMPRNDTSTNTNTTSASSNEAMKIQECLDEYDFVDDMTLPVSGNGTTITGSRNPSKGNGGGGFGDAGGNDKGNKGPQGNNTKPRNGQRPQKIKRQVLNAVGNCTKDYRTCATSNLRKDLQSMPNCTRDSLQALAQCVRNHNNTCASACRVAGNSTREKIPRGLLQPQNLRNCNGIRNAILRPMCRRISCCADCLDAVEAVGDCFVNRVLNFLPQRCESQCPNSSEGGQQQKKPNGNVTSEGGKQEKPSEGGKQEKPNGNVTGEGGKQKKPNENVTGEGGKQKKPNENVTTDEDRFLFMSEQEEQEINNAVDNGWPRRTLANDIDDQIYNSCIELAPGISEDQRSEEELAARGGDFFDCVLDQVFVALDAVNDTVPINPPTTNSPTTAPVDDTTNPPTTNSPTNNTPTMAPVDDTPASSTTNSPTKSPADDIMPPTKPVIFATLPPIITNGSSSSGASYPMIASTTLLLSLLFVCCRD